MNRHPTLPLARFGAFPVSVLVAGVLWALFDVFLLGNWDPKFGRCGSLQLTLVLVGAVSGVALLVNGIVVLLLRRRTSGWPARRHVVVGVGAGLVTIAVLAIGAIVPLVT